MATSSSTPVRDVGLDTLRVFAVIEVVLFHLQLRGGPVPQWMKTIFGQGQIGVDIFFVLSGFLLGSWLLVRIREAPDQILRGDLIRHFLRRRYFKTLPPYFAVLLTLFVAFQMKVTLSHLTFTSNYFAPNDYSLLWSLDVEEIFYLCLPLSLWLLTRTKSPFVIGLFVTMAIIASPLSRYVSWTSPSRAAYLEDIYWPTHTRLDGLVLGVLVSALRVWDTRVWRWLRTHRLALTLIGVGMLGWYHWHYAGMPAVRLRIPAMLEFSYLALMAALLVIGLAGIVSTARWARGVSTLAKATYSIYLAHSLGFHWYEHQVGPWLGVTSPGRTVVCKLLTAVIPVIALYQFESLIHRNQDRIVACLRARWRQVFGQKEDPVTTVEMR